MLPVAEAPQEWRKSTNIDPVSSDCDQVRGNTVQFTNQYADIFNTFRDVLINTQHPLNSHTPYMTVVHRRQVVHAVGKRYSLLISKRFSMFFETAVQVAHMRNYFLYDLTIRDQLQPQNAMC